jgi:hypothetical protein
LVFVRQVSGDDRLAVTFSFEAFCQLLTPFQGVVGRSGVTISSSILPVGAGNRGAGYCFVAACG